MAASDVRLVPLLRESVAIIKSQIIGFALLVASAIILLWLISSAPQDVGTAIKNMIYLLSDAKKESEAKTESTTFLSTIFFLIMEERSSIKELSRLLVQFLWSGSLILSVVATIFHFSRDVIRRKGDCESQIEWAKRAIRAVLSRSFVRHGLLVVVVGMAIVLLWIATSTVVAVLVFLIWFYSPWTAVNTVVIVAGLLVVPCLGMWVATRLCLALPVAALRSCSFCRCLAYGTRLGRIIRPLIVRVHVFYLFIIMIIVLLFVFLPRIVGAVGLVITLLWYVVFLTLLLQRAVNDTAPGETLNSEAGCQTYEPDD